MPNIYKIIGSKIRKYRQESGLSQEDLGKCLDLKRSSIAKIEAGTQRIYVHLLYKIADSCNINVTDLLLAKEWLHNGEDDNLLKEKIDCLIPIKTATKIKRKLEL